MPRKKKSSAAPGQRQLRVGEEIRHALTDIIAQDNLDDPDIQGRMVTVTQVRISPDLRNATAFVTPFGGGEADKLVAALNRAHGYFRRELARIVRLQFSPTIRFREDEIFEQASRIERLLHDPVVARDIAKRDDDDDDGGDAT
jgi:ribosome-binding factor A